MIPVSSENRVVSKIGKNRVVKIENNFHDYSTVIYRETRWHVF